MTLDLGAALQLVVAVSMPFVLYILHGIRSSIHELRDQVNTFALKTATLEAEVANVKRQLRLVTS